MPDRIFENIYAITPEWLSAQGIKAVVLDIDNTLVTYDDAKPTPPVLEWFKGLADVGIKASFVSNNDRERVNVFNAELGFFGQGKSKKPFGGVIRRAMAHMGSTPENTALIGDQIFTDIFAGKCQGLRSYLVPPIKDLTTLFFRSKRFLEKTVINRYYRKHKGEKRVR